MHPSVELKNIPDVEQVVYAKDETVEWDRGMEQTLDSLQNIDTYSELYIYIGTLEKAIKQILKEKTEQHSSSNINNDLDDGIVKGLKDTMQLISLYCELNALVVLIYSRIITAIETGSQREQLTQYSSVSHKLKTLWIPKLIGSNGDVSKFLAFLYLPEKKDMEIAVHFQRMRSS